MSSNRNSSVVDSFNRREFIKRASLAVIATQLPSCANFAQKTTGWSKPNRRVVVIGGGYAGATAAKYLRLWSDNKIEVVVIEPNQYFISCPLSNLVLGGNKEIDNLHPLKFVEDSFFDTSNEKFLHLFHTLLISSP